MAAFYDFAKFMVVLPVRTNVAEVPLTLAVLLCTFRVTVCSGDITVRVRAASRNYLLSQSSIYSVARWHVLP